MSEENGNHQLEENPSKRHRRNPIDQSGNACYNPDPQWRDKYSYKNRNQKYKNRNRKNHSVHDRYDNRYYHRDHHNCERRNYKIPRKNFNNVISRTLQQTDDRLQSSHNNRKREIILPDYEEDFAMDTSELPISGPFETKNYDLRSTDASNFKSLFSLCQHNEQDIILPDYEEDFVMDISESPIIGPSETKNNELRGTDAFSFKNILSLCQHNEEDIVLPDYEEEFLLDTPEAPAPGPSGINYIKSTDVSSFKDLFLKAGIMKSLNNGGYEHASGIQTECIQQALFGHDILAQARSGTGKTLAFILSTLHLLEAKENEVHTLVICPTRELAYQIGKQYECFSKHLPGIRIATFFGGVPIKNDVNVLSNNCPHIVVGTVGRILSLIKSKNLDIQYLKHFVLDECDQMLQLPNTNRQIDEIYLSLSGEMQVMMFSATLNEETRKQCKLYMRNPIEIYMDDKRGPIMTGLVQRYVCLEQNSKFQTLVQLLDSLQYTQVVVFVNSISRCKTLEYSLRSNNYSAIGIHGGLNQADRLKRYEEVRNGKERILVATNVFGRGMDVGGINTVINYDMPRDADSYLHGVTRAGRFDTIGTAISFLTNEEDMKILNEVQTRFQIKITQLSN